MATVEMNTVARRTECFYSMISKALNSWRKRSWIVLGW